MRAPWSSLTPSMWGACSNPSRVSLRLGCICRTYEVVAELTLELLISNPLGRGHLWCPPLMGET
jgi:hypothetical protein